MKPNINLSFFCLAFLCFNYCIAQKGAFAKSTDNTQIYFRTYGSGLPLLIINGGPGMNSNGFENLAIKLSEQYQTIIYDQRGTGKSKMPILDSSTVTMELMIEDIESIRKQLKIEKWTILGHSFGGIVAAFYATKYPEKISKIVFSASGGIDLGLLDYVGNSINSKLSKTELDSLNYWTNKISEGDTTYQARLNRGKALAPAYLFDKKHIPILADRLTQGNNVINGLIWADLQKIKYDCSEKLKTFEQPVLIIQGKQDIIKVETAEKAQKVLENSKIILIDNCGHYGWLDNAEVYFREIHTFLKQSKK